MSATSTAGASAHRPSGPAAFTTLREHYDDRQRAARDWIAAGGGVVGVVGGVAPIELILASGRLPLLVAAEPPHPTPSADLWMEPEFEWELRSLADRAIKGDFELFELLVVTRSYHEVYYYLKEIVRQGQGPAVPPLYMYDLMQSQRPAVRAYGLGRTDDFLARLERLAGAPISDRQLLAAIALTNRKRQLIRALLERRRQGTVSGAAATQAIGAGFFMHPATYADTLADYLAELEPEGGLNGRPHWLVVPSEPLYHPRLHEALEAAGGLVVAEDDWWGARAAGDDIPTGDPPKLAIFEKYFADLPSPAVSPRAPREAWLRAQIERGDVDGVIFYLPPSDHLFGWYYPRLKAFLDDRGVPSLLLRQDVLDGRGQTAVERAATEFVGRSRPIARA